MKLLLAPDSFKGSLTAQEVCAHLQDGLSPQFECISHPLADGGEGSLAAIAAHQEAQWIQHTVSGPLPQQQVTAQYLWIPGSKTAVIEMAQASGLILVPPDKRNAEITTSRGTGELIQAALTQGAESIQIAIGGSATNDAGLGLLSALGWQFLDQEGNPVASGGQGLSQIDQICPPPEPFPVPVTVWCDVTNPLTGKTGAAWVYGPQKGADPSMVERLDQGLTHLQQVVERQFGVDLDFPGAGAAGGLAAGVVWGLNAKPQSGFQAIAALTGLTAAIQQVDGVITGEGCFDGQSIQGKVVGEVVKLCRTAQKPIVLLAGQILLQEHPDIDALVSIVDQDCPVSQALANPSQSLTQKIPRLNSFWQSWEQENRRK